MSDKAMNEFDELPNRIRQIRQNKGLSQENMADGLGISTSAYGDLERGKTEITLSRLIAIAGIFGLEALQLLGSSETVLPEKEWLKEENRRLLRENAELIFKNELLEKRLRTILIASQEERQRIGF